MRLSFANPRSLLNLSAIWLFLFFAFMQLTTWIPLRYWRIWGGGNFIDSQQVLQWAKCYETQGNLVFMTYGDCSGYIYGSTLLRILSFFNLDVTQTQFFGYLFMILLAMTISMRVNTLEKFKENPLIILIVLSPPVLLLAERGNFDVLVFALISLSGVLFARNHEIWAVLPLALATLLKFYTLPVFLLFILLNENRRYRLTTFFVATAVTVRVFLDLQLIQTTFPSGYSWKFGSSIWTRYLTQLNIRDTGELVNNLSGLAILALTIVLTLVAMKRKLITPNDVSGQRIERILFYVLLLTHISCFLVGMSFDYRLIFLAMASIIYLKSFCEGKDSYLVLVLSLISLWLTYPSSGLEPVGDFATEILTVILGIRFLQLVRVDVKSKNAK